MSPIPEDNVASESQRENTKQSGPPPTTQPRRRRHKQLSTDSLNWGIPHNEEATLHVQEETGEESWRYLLIKTLHGRRVQMLLAFLLLLDVVILFTELALLTMFPMCSYVERDAISCCPTQGEYPADEGMRWLAGSDYYSCAPGFEPFKDTPATCDSHKWHTVHAIEKGLIIVTIAILTIFFVELNLAMIALTPQIFFLQVFYAADYFVVTVSLGLEVTFFSLGDDVLTALVGLVIFGRIWRFVRIGHGIVELTGEMTHERQEEEAVYTKELEKLLEQHGIPLPDDTPRHHSGHTCELLERVHTKHLDKKWREYRQKSSMHGSSNDDP